MPHFSTKTYGHDVGLSACFRQHKATSHCRFLHGYALAVTIKFGANELDERNWVIDFGGLGTFKDSLKAMFDHTLLIAQDDPHVDELGVLAGFDLADVRIVEATGCEAFAKLIFKSAEAWLVDNGHVPRVWVQSVEVREHGANSAIYEKDAV